MSFLWCQAWVLPLLPWLCFCVRIEARENNHSMLMLLGMLFCTSPVPGNAEAVPASGVAVWGSKESLRTETLLASFSPETPSSWGPSVRHLPWGTSLMISYLISLEDLTQNREVSVSFIVTFSVFLFSGILLATVSNVSKRICFDIQLVNGRVVPQTDTYWIHHNSSIPDAVYAGCKHPVGLFWPIWILPTKAVSLGSRWLMAFVFLALSTGAQFLLGLRCHWRQLCWILLAITLLNVDLASVC